METKDSVDVAWKAGGKEKQGKELMPKHAFEMSTL